MLKHYRIIRKWACKNNGLNDSDLELLIYLDCIDLFTIKDYLRKPGLISSLFLIFYSIFRFFIEFYRVPDEQLGFIFLNLTMGQFISLIFLCFGFYIFFKKKNENK